MITPTRRNALVAASARAPAGQPAGRGRVQRTPSNLRSFQTRTERALIWTSVGSSRPSLAISRQGPRERHHERGDDDADCDVDLERESRRGSEAGDVAVVERTVAVEVGRLLEGDVEEDRHGVDGGEREQHGAVLARPERPGGDDRPEDGEQVGDPDAGRGVAGATRPAAAGPEDVPVARAVVPVLPSLGIALAHQPITRPRPLAYPAPGSDCAPLSLFET